MIEEDTKRRSRKEKRKKERTKRKSNWRKIARKEQPRKSTPLPVREGITCGNINLLFFFSFFLFISFLFNLIFPTFCLLLQSTLDIPRERRSSQLNHTRPYYSIRKRGEETSKWGLVI